MIAGVIVPGRGYGPQAPLLDLAGEALADRDAAVETINWTVPDGLLEIGPEPFVRAHVTAALHRLAGAAPATQPVIIAKSLGNLSVEPGGRANWFWLPGWVTARRGGAVPCPAGTPPR